MMAQRRKSTPTDKQIRQLPWPDAFLQAQALTTNDSYRVGQLLVERVYDSQRDANRSPKPSSLRKIQSNALPEVSVSTLLRCIQVYETCRTLGMKPPWRYVRAGHLFRVANLSKTQQRQLLSSVEREGWTVARLQQEIDKLKGNRLTNGRRPSGRRRLPGFVKALQALSKHSLLDGLKQAEELDANKLRQLGRQIARTQTELNKVQTALRKKRSN
jgi:hypothetical protein